MLACRSKADTLLLLEHYCYFSNQMLPHLPFQVIFQLRWFLLMISIAQNTININFADAATVVHTSIGKTL